MINVYERGEQIAELYDLNDLACYLNTTLERASVIYSKAKRYQCNIFDANGKKVFIQVQKPQNNAISECRKKRQVERCKDCLHYEKCSKKISTSNT